jgi:hypothetical protein
VEDFAMFDAAQQRFLRRDRGDVDDRRHGNSLFVTLKENVANLADLISAGPR